MKSLVKFFAFLLCFFGTASEIKSQQYPCTVIDVRGSRYGDSMWLFTVEGTTDGYDNGWDGLKMFGSTLAPQLFAVGSDLRNYQVYTSSNIHGVDIAFRKGEDLQYVFYFKHYEISSGYQQLYLLDKKTMTVVDIYSENSQYSFSCETGDDENRFSILTYLSNSASSEETESTTDTFTEITDSVINNEESVSDPADLSSTVKDKGKNKTKEKNAVRAFSVNGDLVIDNTLSGKAKVTITGVSNGQMLQSYEVSAQSITTIRAGLKKGAYVVNVSSENVDYSITIVV